MGTKTKKQKSLFTKAETVKILKQREKLLSSLKSIETIVDDYLLALEHIKILERHFNLTPKQVAEILAPYYKHQSII